MAAVANVRINGSSSPLTQNDFTAVALSNADNTDVVSWSWVCAEAPEGSAYVASPTAGFSAPTASTTTFTPDKEGSYRIQLTVLDGGAVSDSDVNELAVTFQHVRLTTVGWHGLLAAKYRSPVSGETTEFDGTYGWKNQVHRMGLAIDKIAGLQKYVTVKIKGDYAGMGNESVWRAVDIATLPNGDLVPVVLPVGSGSISTLSESNYGSMFWNEQQGLAAGTVTTMLAEGLTGGVSLFGLGAAIPGVPVYAPGSSPSVTPGSRKIGHIAAQDPANGVNYIYFRPGTSREWQPSDVQGSQGGKTFPSVTAANVVSSLSDGDTLTFKVNGGSTYTMTFSGGSGYHQSGASGVAFPYTGTLSTYINSAPHSIGIVAAANFGAIATQIQSYLTTNSVEAVATHEGGGVIKIASTKEGYNSTVSVDPSGAGTDLLFNTVDPVFAQGNISDLSSVSIADLVAAFRYEGFGEMVSVSDDGTGKAVLSGAVGAGSSYSIQVMGGTSNAAFGFSTSAVTGTNGADTASYVLFQVQMATNEAVSTGSYVAKGKVVIDPAWFTGYNRAELLVWASADAGTIKTRLWNATTAAAASSVISLTGDGDVHLGSDDTDTTLSFAAGVNEYHLQALIDGGATAGVLWTVQIVFL